jgi:hypothetical protein
VEGRIIVSAGKVLSLSCYLCTKSAYKLRDNA